MELNSLSILMFIFATCVLIVGIYMHTGHKLGIFEYRAGFRNLTKEKWINIGKWTMISSIFIFLFAIISMFFEV